MSTNKINKALFYRRDVGKAIEAVAAEMAAQHVAGTLVARLDEVRRDYSLMCEFLCRGMRDGKIDEVYDNLLRRLCSIAADMEVERRVKTYASYGRARAASASCELQPEAVRAALEGYVQDMAMASFENEDKRQTLTTSLRTTHHAYMKSLFDGVMTSGMWNETLCRDYTELLVSPTIDVADAMLVVSAVMLSAMNVFDPYKWLVLADVFSRSSSEQLRQRAFVGWVFALPSKRQAELFGEVESRLQTMLVYGAVRKELLELQLQVLFCCNADADNDEIRKDIMPTLLKNSNFKMTRLGIEEKEDDPMDDIMDPDAANRNIEEAEQKFRKMMDMQKAGSDIYFGGFSQMKRFPFFNELCNWFAPFDVEHPMLGSVREKLSDANSMTKLLDKAPFCDSDKYSFACAMASVIDRLPANVREMLGTDVAIGPVPADDERESGAYVRRSYLQSVFRFFRLNNWRADFVNPFVLDCKVARNAVFLASDIMACAGLADEAAALGGFLYKRGLYAQLDSLLDNFAFVDDVRLTKLRAMNCMKEGRHNEAYGLLMQLVDGDSTDDVTRLLASSCFATRRFSEAAVLYRRLLETNPSSLAYGLNLAVCLMKGDGLEEGAKILFRLDYEHPDCDNVKRALAWCLMLQGNAEKASEMYGRLLGGDAVAADYLNAGYARWFVKDIAGALELMRKYCSMTRNDDGTANISSDFANDSALLDKYGIRASERKIVADMAAKGDDADASV